MTPHRGTYCFLWFLPETPSSLSWTLSRLVLMLKTCCFKHWGALDPLPLYATTLLSADVDRMENWILLNNNKELTVYYFPF